MPGPTPERPRAHRLTDIEPQAAKGLGCSRMDDFSTPCSSGSNMGSIARFPKLDECAHFHYEHVELGALEVSVSEGPNDSDTYAVRVTSGDACWTLQRSYDNFVMFDKQLHRCIFDRKFSSLTKLPDSQPESTVDILRDYLNRFSQLNHEGLNCGPVLNWLQLDNRGRRILVPEADSCPINTPAVAAAYAVRPYVAQAQDEISFQVGDMISVIDMPPPGESTWWRGKHGFAVGFFPAECVAVIGDKVPRHLTVSTTVRSRLPVKPVLRKHGKLIAFFRSFILNRPSRRRLKQSGILRERVFGCDLGEHLLNSGQDVPTVLTCCTEFIENHGLVDGIYRLSGVTSNIQKLRHAFDEDRVPALHSDESILQDIHSVASLLKMYFRELPNPLCTYQLYASFVGAVQAGTDAERLRRMRDAVRKLPPPHYRTLEYLMRHLARVAARGTETGMTPRNVAIVWAPNLLRCKELEVGGVAALQGVGVQAVVTEFLVCYAELIFGDGPVGRPKSLAITTSSRLLSLEEARNRTLRGEPDYIEVGAGPAGLPLQYHTVIELPRKRHGSKRSPSLNWRALFSRGGLGTRGKTRQARTPPQGETIPPNSLNSLRRLRPVKSADSLDGEDSLGPLLGPPPTRPCGHSRSVSHDSYFDHLADAPNATSPLDLSEIQLNFDLEEREMRMFSEEDGGGVASIEASPRRHRVESSQCTAASGGSKRKRSRLEERLHCDVELRFIDSQSPDQVMVSADIHGVETPSPLPTPGYLPLLSEASTPLTPATLQGTPLSISPIPTNSPRISFRSFTLPIDLNDEQNNRDTLNRGSMSSEMISDSSRRLSVSLDNQSNVKLCETVAAYDRLIESYDSRITVSSENQELVEESNGTISESLDQEMTSCDRLASPCSETTDTSRVTSSCKDVASSERSSLYLADDKPQCDNSDVSDVPKQDTPSGRSLGSQNDDVFPEVSSVRENEFTGLQLSGVDLDSPMSYEQTLDDLLDSGFVICNNSDKMFGNSETQQRVLSSANNSGEWVMVERTAESSLTSTSKSCSSPDNCLDGTGDPAIVTAAAAAAAQLQSASENISRTSLALTVDTDSSCIEANELIESSVLIRDTDGVTLNVNESRTFMKHVEDDENLQRMKEASLDAYCRTQFNYEDTDNDFANDKRCSVHDKAYGQNQSNGRENYIQSAINLETNEEQSNKMEHANNDYNYLASDKHVRCTNRNKTDKEKKVSVEQAKHDNCPSTVGSHGRQQQQKQRAQDRQRIPRVVNPERHNCSNQPLNELAQNQYTKKQQYYDRAQQSKYLSKHVQDGTNKRNGIQNSQMRADVEVVIPSENAAEPCEIAHTPEGAAEGAASTLDSLRTFSNASSSIDDSVVLRDTAAILEELALQRLSGNGAGDMSIPARRKYDSEITRDRRSFDSEIGREIVRERKMRQELDCARGKSEEPPNSNSQHLPPCLRARQARATRATLSRSLDEAKFNLMTGESSLSMKQGSEDSQHSSTPNVGTELTITSSNERIQSKNLGGLDLGDPRCRERIEKYKEERRTFLRDKYRSESFRGVTSKAEDDEEQALLARLKQRASRPSLH